MGGLAAAAAAAEGAGERDTGSPVDLMGTIDKPACYARQVPVMMCCVLSMLTMLPPVVVVAAPDSLTH